MVIQFSSPAVSRRSQGEENRIHILFMLILTIFFIEFYRKKNENEIFSINFPSLQSQLYV